MQQLKRGPRNAKSSWSGFLESPSFTDGGLKQPQTTLNQAYTFPDLLSSKNSLWPVAGTPRVPAISRYSSASEARASSPDPRICVEHELDTCARLVWRIRARLISAGQFSGSTRWDLLLVLKCELEQTSFWEASVCRRGIVSRKHLLEGMVFGAKCWKYDFLNRENLKHVKYFLRKEY